MSRPGMRHCSTLPKPDHVLGLGELDLGCVIEGQRLVVSHSIALTYPPSIRIIEPFIYEALSLARKAAR